MSDVKDKTVWITGASSGIGAALAKTFSQAGANIILSGRGVDALEQVAKSLKTKTKIIPFEVTDYESLAEHVNTAWNWNGRCLLYTSPSPRDATLSRMPSSA